jgi:predicted DsbA family dithiol-disulfide isomerase
MKTVLLGVLRVWIGLAITISICLVEGDTAYSQANSTVVAVVNGKNITQKEVDESVISRLLPLEEQIYALRKAAVENLVIKAILEDVAKKRGVSVDQLKKQMTAGKIEIPSGEVEQAYAENASVFGSMSPDEAKERLRLDLESSERMKLYRDALSELRKNARVELRLEEPRLPAMSEVGAPSTGAKNAAVTIVEFSDFQCPYCRGSQGTLKQILQSYGNSVRLVFKHLPLDIHPEAFPAAQAAFCAGEQGSFWQYHDALFASDGLSRELFNKFALDLRLDLPKFRDCLKSEVSHAAILKDVNEAKRLGINGTPTFIINGRLFRGSINLEDFKRALDSELKDRQGNSGGQ